MHSRPHRTLREISILKFWRNMMRITHPGSGANHMYCSKCDSKLFCEIFHTLSFCAASGMSAYSGYTIPAAHLQKLNHNLIGVESRMNEVHLRFQDTRSSREACWRPLFNVRMLRPFNQVSTKVFVCCLNL